MRPSQPFSEGFAFEVFRCCIPGAFALLLPPGLVFVLRPLTAPLLRFSCAKHTLSRLKPRKAPISDCGAFLEGLPLELRPLPVETARPRPSRYCPGFPLMNLNGANFPSIGALIFVLMRFAAPLLRFFPRRRCLVYPAKENGL